MSPERAAWQRYMDDARARVEDGDVGYAVIVTGDPDGELAYEVVSEDGASEPTVFAEKAEKLISSDCVAAVSVGVAAGPDEVGPLREVPHVAQELRAHVVRRVHEDGGGLDLEAGLAHCSSPRRKQKNQKTYLR